MHFQKPIFDFLHATPWGPADQTKSARSVDHKLERMGIVQGFPGTALDLFQTLLENLIFRRQLVRPRPPFSEGRFQALDRCREAALFSL